jgi:arabinofuranan 3-O-arabinosyltransferase
VVGLLVVAPWMRGGYLLLLDWVSGPNSAISPGLYGLSDNALDAMPWRLGVAGLRAVLGPVATAWLIVLLPFPIAAAGTAHLVRMRRLPSYAAALVATCSPIIVDRVMAGHVAYLLGLSLLPWLLSSALNARSQDRWFSARTAGWFAVALAVSPHMAWLGGVVLLLVTVLPKPRWIDVARLVLTGLAAAAIYAFAFVVVLTGVPTLKITDADLAAFATKSGPGGLLPTVLSLHGYWRDWDGQVRNVLGNLGWLAAAAAATVIVVGIVSLISRGNRRGPLAVALIAVGAVLAVGSQGPMGFVYSWLFHNLPLFSTMREPAKWLGLVQLGYVLAVAGGVEAIGEWKRPTPALRRVLAIGAACLPLVVLPALAWGLGGRVDTSTYPQSWTQAAAQLDAAPARTLFLPWHGYQPFPFTGLRTVATPAEAFFPGSVLSSDAVELGRLRTASSSQQQRVVDELVAAGGGSDFAESLAQLGVTHVAVSRGLEDDRYAWVAEQPGLTSIQDSPDLQVFRVDVPVPGIARLTPAGPAAFSVAAGESGTVILPVEYSSGWKLNGRSGTPTAEGTIAFQVGAESGVISYAPWAKIKLGIAISLAALLVLLVFGLIEHRHDLRLRAAIHVRLRRAPPAATATVTHRLRQHRLWEMTRARLKAGRPYFAVFLISSVVVSRWFVPGTFIATGDMGPWIRQGWAPEATSSWNHTISGAGSAAFTVARGFELYVLKFVGLFGGDEYVGQWLFYTLIYGLVAVGVTFAARAIVKSEPAAVAAGTFAVLSGFFLTRLPNPLNIISVGSIALLTGLALRVARGRSIGAPWAGIALLPTSFLAFNPPMIVVAYAWTLLGLPILVGLMLGWTAVVRLLKWMVFAAPWAVLLNIWWLVPFAYSYLGGGGAVANADFTDPTAWSWSQAQNQIPNILTMVANWAWVKPQYLPFAADLDQPWIIWARYLIPALVFLAPVLAIRKLRRAALVLVSLSLVFLFLAKGLQPPFAKANLFLYNHVPGFWLFREPMSKLGQLLVIFFGMLFAILLDSVWERWRDNRTTVNRVVKAVAWSAFIVVILQPYPLWTGAVIPDVRPQQPSAHVRVPQYWRDLATRINEDKRPGKVLVMPLDDYYQMPTTWGFAGVDSIPNLLIQHPVVQPKPDGYFGEVPGFGANVHAVETALISGDLDAVPRLLEASGISQIIVRHDLVRGMPGRSFADDRILTAALEMTPGMTRVTTGDLDLWFLGDGSLPDIRTYDAVLPAPARPTAGSAAIATMPTNVAIAARKADPGIVSAKVDVGAAVSTGDVVHWPVPAVDSGEPTTSIVTNAGSFAVGERARAAAVLVPSMRTTSASSDLVLSDPTALQIDGTTVLTRPDLVVPVPSPDVLAVTANTRTVSLDGWMRDTLPGATTAEPRPAYLPIGSDTTLTAWAPSVTPAAPSTPSAVYDCDNYEPRPARELGLRLEQVSTGSGRVLRLTAKDHAACTQITVPDAKPGRTYRVRMQFRTVDGKRPEVCLWQLGTDGCDLVPRAPVSKEWLPFEQFITVDSVATGLQVVLYANVGERHAFTTVTEYRDISIEALDPVLTTTVFPPQLPRKSIDLAAGEHTLAVTGGQAGSSLGEFGPLENCYNTKQMTPAQAGLSKTILTGEPQPAFRLTAQFDRACIAAPVPDMGASSLYELSYDGRSVNLRNPSVCLYQRGPDACTKIPAGGPWKDWYSYRTFVGPDPAAIETRLYLLGSRDLEGKQQSVVEYRGVKLRPVASPVDVVLVRQVPTAPSAQVDYSRSSASSYGLTVTGATPAHAVTDSAVTATFVALNETYAPGWTAQAAQGVDGKGHLALQGWMNAWPVTDAAASARLAYGPDRYAQIALKMFPVVLALAIGWLIVRRPVRAWTSAQYRRRFRRTRGALSG